MVNNKKLKGHAPVSQLFKPANSRSLHRRSGISAKTEISIQGLHSNGGKHTDLNDHTTRKPLELYYKTKKPAPGLIQRYRSCYPQKRVIQKRSGRKGLLARRNAWSGTSQILFLHLLFSLIRFGTKIMPSLQKPSRGEPLKLPPGEWLQQTAKASDTASTISPPGTRRPEWISLEKQGQRPRR